jgi:hypothetical protein
MVAACNLEVPYFVINSLLPRMTPFKERKFESIINFLSNSCSTPMLLNNQKTTSFIRTLSKELKMQIKIMITVALFIFIY